MTISCNSVYVQTETLNFTFAQQAVLSILIPSQVVYKYGHAAGFAAVCRL